MSEPPPPAVSQALSLRDRANGIVAAATVLALLYFGRDVLIPLTLAVILSLLIAPLVRRLRRVGLGPTSSALVAVLSLASVCAAVAVVIGVQVVRMAASLPQYEDTIKQKMETLDNLTIGSVNLFTGQAGRLLNREAAAPPGSAAAPGSAAVPGAGAARGARPVRSLELASPASADPIPVVLHDPPTNPIQVIEKVLGSIWIPIETAGIVLVVLVFVLLEHEALRDRFIRIAGGTDIRSTTIALNDAGERLSRFFVSQFAVNIGVGVFIWIGLTLLGLPHAALWAALAGVLRFVPYVGIWIAALFSTVLAAAVDAGWSLAIMTLSLYVIVEMVAGQLIEPQLYGHTTGLSPLSVVIAAIFWSWLWGPIGLIVSTPLTLCLLVAGRHIKALSLLDILLGDEQALTMPQRFYQRALSGDSQEIIAGARMFLKRNSFAVYCDVVLMPALHLARLDLETGAISNDQLTRVRDTIVAVIAAIGGDSRRIPRRRTRVSVLDSSSAGRLLRQQREQQTGQWQGPLEVPPGSIVLCMGLGSPSDDLATELLVRILRDQKVDARHVSVDDLQSLPPPGAVPGSVLMIYIVSAFPSDDRDRGEAVAEQLRSQFPHACLITVFLPGMLLAPGSPIADLGDKVDKSASSLGEAVQICLNWREKTSGV